MVNYFMIPGNAEIKNTRQGILDILEEVHDPEIPVLSIADLGILRDVIIEGQDLGKQTKIRVIITPTYSGCPAMDMIRKQIHFELIANGYPNAVVESQLSPAWTTDWISESGKQKLKAFGIAPPNPTQQVCQTRLFQHEEAIQCPRCNSYHTQLISQFGSTPCKAHYRCLDCEEPFDYFKCH
jgi:ring-1,2-phenylacetyl-CoA epoxidase subunit PaaD